MGGLNGSKFSGIKRVEGEEVMLCGRRTGGGGGGREGEVQG